MMGMGQCGPDPLIPFHTPPTLLSPLYPLPLPGLGTSKNTAITGAAHPRQGDTDPEANAARGVFPPPPHHSLFFFSPFPPSTEGGWEGGGKKTLRLQWW